MVILSVLFLFPGCSPSIAPVSNDAQETSSEPAMEQVFYEDDILKATFIDVVEQELVPGCAYIRVVFENKSDNDIIVIPSESSVNDMMVQYFSGTPASMKAGKKLNYAWFFSLETANISSVDEIEKLEFSLKIDDANMHQIAETGVINIEVKEHS